MSTVRTLENTSISIFFVYCTITVNNYHASASPCLSLIKCLMSIDNGQFEAARSLGLNYRQTMIQVILPQAFKNVLPALANEFIVLLKETSISGYIGLNDLTRGGDIIRSITYDPMLPLFGVALIYLVLVVILSSLVKKLERRLRSNERH